VGTAVDLDGLVHHRRLLEHALPFAPEAGPAAVDATPGMGQHVHGRVAHRGHVSIGLVLRQPQLGVERAEHQIESTQRVAVHVLLSLG
jgi:hypothetical protein